MTKPWKASASHARMRRIKTRIRLLEPPKCCIRIENRKEGSMGRDDSTSWLLTFGGGSSSGRVIVDVDAELREDGVGPAMDWPGRRRRTPSRMRKL